MKIKIVRGRTLGDPEIVTYHVQVDGRLVSSGATRKDAFVAWRRGVIT
jgi:hypothetical protein